MTKIEHIRSMFDTLHIDALLVTNPINRRYVTSFTGTAGVALITKDHAFFITDFRYVEQAKDQAVHFHIVEHEGPIELELSKKIKQLDIKCLGFEAEDVTYSQYELYQKTFGIELHGVRQVIESLRLIKTENEIHILKQAAKIADDAFEYILDEIKPGVREIDIAHKLEIFMRQQGATSSSFDIIVASGYRSALPHGIASEKKIEAGELVTLDYGALYQGYVSDITRTVAVGEITEQLQNIYHIVLEAQQRGLNGIKEGITCRQADALTRDFITEQGYGQCFGHSTGHGIGLEVHEGPGLSPRSDVTLRENMVVTVEPGIYLPQIGGCRIEDDIVITKGGNERLTWSTKEFIQL